MAEQQTRRLALYRESIRAGCPSIDVETIHLNLEGQNNDVVTVNGSLIFRFPRYRSGIDRLHTEVGLLRTVRRHVTLPVPNPAYSRLDSGAVGEVFMGYEAIRGEPLRREVFGALPAETRQGIADQLGTFLRELHGIPVSDVLAVGAPISSPLTVWEDLFERIRDRLFPHMDVRARRWTVQHFESFLTDPRNRSVEPVLVHGDFGASNILIDRQTNAVTGVIDFSSAGLDDPAVDLAAASTLGSDLLPRLYQSYPGARAAAKRVAFYRGTFALQEALFGVENGDEQALQAGLAGLLPSRHAPA